MHDCGSGTEGIVLVSMESYDTGLLGYKGFSTEPLKREQGQNGREIVELVKMELFEKGDSLKWSVETFITSVELSNCSFDLSLDLVFQKFSSKRSI